MKPEKFIHTRVTNTEPFNFQHLYSSGIVPSQIHIFNNMGCLYQRNNNSEKALQYFKKALNDDKSDRINKATVCDNIGLLYYGEGNYETAAEYLLQALAFARDHSSLPKFKQHYDAINKHCLSRKTSLTKEINDS